MHAPASARRGSHTGQGRARGRLCGVLPTTRTKNAGDGYRLPHDSHLRPLAFDGDEAKALAVAGQALATGVEGPMRDALATATAKLQAGLSPAARRRVA